MTQNTTDDATDDPRSTDMKHEMAQHFSEFEADYRDGGWNEIVYEDDQVVIVADEKGYELNEWCEDFPSINRDDLSEYFHRTARSLMDDQRAHDIFSTAYPVVFDKLKDSN